MPWHRIYVDKKIDPLTETGGEHSRSFDCEANDETDATNQLTLMNDEAINQAVSLGGDPR